MKVSRKQRVVRDAAPVQCAAVLIVVAAVLGVARAQIPQPTDAPKPLSPDETAASYVLPDGFRLQVVASEPLIASPSGVCWDERGRMFVSELHGYNLEGQLDIEELNKTGKLDTQVRRVQAEERFKHAAKPGTYGVIKVLHDDDGDGRMDRSEIWTTNLPPAYGLVPARGGVIVACAPDIVYLADRDGDGRAEVRETLFTGFRTGALERGINSPRWGVDGWIYFGRGWSGGRITGPKLAKPVTLPDSDFRIRADGSALEPVTGGTHTFGFTMTDSGDRFVITTTIPGIYVAPLPWRYLLRNPNAATPSVEVPTGDRRAYPVSKPHPWRQRRADDPAYFKFYRDRYGPAESEASGWFTAACSPLVYRDPVLPGLHRQYFVCEPAGNLIHRAVIEGDGSVLSLHRAPGEERSEFAASPDAWSHPISLAHGPDGAIWVVDYYREIIEDYSAIPRHLQQQYGVYAGHDRGRVYRLTYRDVPKPPSADMIVLSGRALARECASSLLWRRLTAQRLLVERGDSSAVAVALRELLRGQNVAGPGLITVMRTLDQLRALQPVDVLPFVHHRDRAVRIHALQLADEWFAREEGGELLNAALAGAAAEEDPRVLIQFALSLGEARDSRAFATLVGFAREHLDIRWMGAAVLSSTSGRGVDLLAELLREPGHSRGLLEPLAKSIAAGGDEEELALTVKLLGYAEPDTQAVVLQGLAEGRNEASRRPPEVPSIGTAIEAFAESSSSAVRAAAQGLADTFVAAAVNDEALDLQSGAGTAESVSEETFRSFLTALAEPRDLDRGHQVYRQACATCHRIGNEGFAVGPDLVGQLGMAEESLLHDLLMPSSRIRPGYEATQVRLRNGTVEAGLLQEDNATSLTLAQAGGVQLVLLRKDIAEILRLSSSLMPPFAEGLTPADAANLLGWLKSVIVQPRQTDQ